MKKTHIKSLSIAIALLLVLLTCFDAFTSTNQPPAGYTGAPSESNCTNCHSGTVITSGSNWNNITLNTNIPATGYVPDSIYYITLSHTQSGIVKFGFEVTVLNGSNTKAGTLMLSNTTTTAISNGTRDYIMQKTAGTSGSGTISWSFQWKAPATPAGNITFYTAINASNNNNSDNGDQIYTKAFTFSQSTLLPTATITKSANTICTGDTLYLQGSGTNNPTIFNWTTTGGNPATSTQQNPKIVYTNPGTYSISLVTKNNIGTSTPATTNITVNAKPINTVNASGPLKFCKGDSVVLTAAANGTLSYAWSHGPVTKSVAVKDSGSYTVTVTNTSTGCSTTSNAQVIKVNPLPVVTLTSSDNNDTICQGDTVTFTATSGKINYLFKDAAVILQNSSSNIYKTVNFSLNNRIMVIATDSNNCKSLPADTIRTRVIQKLSAPLVSCGTSTTSSVIFSWDTIPGATGYEISLDTGKTWQTPGSGSTGLTHSITGLNYSQPVPIQVRATNQAPCFIGFTGNQTCTTLSCSGITFNLDIDSAVCKGDSAHIRLTNISKPEYAINFNNNGYTKEVAFNLLPVSSSTYNLLIIDSTALNCPAIQLNVQVNVHPVTIPAINRMFPTPGSNLCQGSEVLFGYSVTASQQLASYTFCFMNGDTFRTSSSPFLYSFVRGNTTDTLLNDSAFYVIGLDINQCLAKSAGITLSYTIRPLPAVKFSQQIYAYQPGSNIQFVDSTPTGVNWKWDFGDGATSTLQNPTHTYPPVLNVYILKKTVTDSFGCQDSASAVLQITSSGWPIGLKEFDTQNLSLFPNPASDQIFFRLPGITTNDEVMIYDLLGKQVTHECFTSIPGAELIKLDIRKLPAGMYLVKVKTLKGIFESKFLKSAY